MSNTHCAAMNPPCMGTLQKTHSKSKFKRFHANSPLADLVFSSNPRLADKGCEIVALQIMCFGNHELLMEYVNKQDWDESGRMD